MTVIRPIGTPTPETARPSAATKRPGNATSAPRSATRSSPISPRQLAPRGNPLGTIGRLRPRTAATPEATAAPPPATASSDATHAASLRTDHTSAAIPAPPGKRRAVRDRTQRSSSPLRVDASVPRASSYARPDEEQAPGVTRSRSRFSREAVAQIGLEAAHAERWETSRRVAALASCRPTQVTCWAWLNMGRPITDRCTGSVSVSR
jgi:hypothetical protein